MKTSCYGKRIILSEALGFCGLFLLLWVDEIYDLPHLFMGAPATPVNYQEALFESLLVLILGLTVIIYTIRSMDHVRLLKGLLPICCACKKIRDDKGYWMQIESYLRNHSEADFSHCICPECAKKLYPEYDLNEP
jgi:hypothetical protein